jgi:hypothetical protein
MGDAHYPDRGMCHAHPAATLAGMNPPHNLQRTGRFAVGLIAVALLATACSHSTSGPGVAHVGSSANGSGSPSSSASASALAFSQCMRTHGVRNFPDPVSTGGIPKVGPQQLGVSSTEFETAQSACAHLLQPNQAQVQEMLSGMRDFSVCMRSHGVHSWPDPTIDSDGQPVFDLHGRIDPDTPQIDHTSTTCSRRLNQASTGQEGTTLCNGIGEAGCHHYG